MKQNILVYILSIAIVIVLVIVIVQMLQISSLNKKIDEKNAQLALPLEKETVIEYVASEPEIVVQNVGFEKEPVLRLSENALAYIRNQGGVCVQGPRSIDKVADCLQRLVEEVYMTPEMKEVSFSNYDPFSETPGKIIYKNTGDFSFDSSNFSLEMNNEIVDEGCLQPGTLTPGSSCVLNFHDICISSDILELNYNNERILLKHC